MNYKHVDVELKPGTNPFGALQDNPVPRESRVS
jgi:hypothetical protein